MRQWALSSLAEHGLPDVVLQIAGTVITPANIEDINSELFAHVMDVNFMGAVCGMRAFLPVMRKANKGFIITMISEWGRIGKAG